ncbi:CLUMA_CG008085, isoform A [Clunio marinus]|uniref:CLUMA_CG008085, isoform A n=1 Tax=Clunio marinus TaxID=568069 RepID=A0A1J1I854_9DIPT|nr:CLUMA_CG008085, isoform A [Clunio marinus]
MEKLIVGRNLITSSLSLRYLLSHDVGSRKGRKEIKKVTQGQSMEKIHCEISLLWRYGLCSTFYHHHHHHMIASKKISNTSNGEINIVTRSALTDLTAAVDA